MLGTLNALLSGFVAPKRVLDLPSNLLVLFIAAKAGSSIPGIGPVMSRELVYLLAAKPFLSAKQVANYVGVIPKLQQSGKWEGHTRLSKEGPSRLRAKLYMAAVVAKQHNPVIRAKYERLLASGKNKMQALGAAMRKLVHIGFGVVKNQQEFQPQAL